MGPEALQLTVESDSKALAQLAILGGAVCYAAATVLARLGLLLIFCGLLVAQKQKPKNQCTEGKSLVPGPHKRHSLSNSEHG